MSSIIPATIKKIERQQFGDKKRFSAITYANVVPKDGMARPGIHPVCGTWIPMTSGMDLKVGDSVEILDMPGMSLRIRRTL